MIALTIRTQISHYHHGYHHHHHHHDQTRCWQYLSKVSVYPSTIINLIIITIITVIMDVPAYVPTCGLTLQCGNSCWIWWAPKLDKPMILAWPLDWRFSRACQDSMFLPPLGEWLEAKDTKGKQEDEGKHGTQEGYAGCHVFMETSRLARSKSHRAFQQTKEVYRLSIHIPRHVLSHSLILNYTQAYRSTYMRYMSIYPSPSFLLLSSKAASALS